MNVGIIPRNGAVSDDNNFEIVAFLNEKAEAVASAFPSIWFGRWGLMHQTLAVEFFSFFSHIHYNLWWQEAVTVVLSQLIEQVNRCL